MDHNGVKFLEELARGQSQDLLGHLGRPAIAPGLYLLRYGWERPDSVPTRVRVLEVQETEVVVENGRRWDRIQFEIFVAMGALVRATADGYS